MPTFYKSDDIEANHVTIGLYKVDGRTCAKVHPPITVDAEELRFEVIPQDGQPAEETLKSATRLAERLGRLVFVQDNDNLWQDEWGDLLDYWHPGEHQSGRRRRP